MAWLETPLDAEFSLIRQRRADAGLGWLTAADEALPAPLDVMSLGEFEPVAWVPSAHPAASRGGIGLDELAGMEVVHGPRRVEPGTYDAWLAVLRAEEPALCLRRPAVPAVAADDPRLRGHRQPAHRGADRPAASHRGPARTAPARGGRQMTPTWFLSASNVTR